MKERTEHHNLNRRDIVGTTASVVEVTASFPGKWFLMKVTEFDEEHNPLLGEILACCATRRAISKQLEKYPIAKRPPNNPFYIFKAEPFSRSGEELRLALANPST